jgi:tRNA dimethylallyltransferase
VVIAGPTASGKTAVGIRLAERLGAEIVNADSQQIYKHFDIGTAKPSAGELKAVRHHLVSALEPSEQCSAGRYAELADAAIAELLGRGRRAVVVGGTGLYIRFLLHGVMDAPPADVELRARLTEEAEARGVPALHAKLAAIDPEMAARIEPNDPIRIIRALEIHALTGTSPSERRAQHAFAKDRYPYQLFVLNPPREALYAAIDARARSMFQRGLLQEVRSLIERGFRDAPPMGSVGYAEALSVIEGRITEEEAVAPVARRTRQYAKRQLTWFRKERGAQFLSPPYAELDALS